MISPFAFLYINIAKFQSSQQKIEQKISFQTMFIKKHRHNLGEFNVKLKIKLLIKKINMQFLLIPINFKLQAMIIIIV